MGTLKTIPVELGLNQPIVSALMALALHQAQTQTQEDPAVEAVLQPALVLMALSSLQRKYPGENSREDPQLRAESMWCWKQARRLYLHGWNHIHTRLKHWNPTLWTEWTSNMYLSRWN